MAFFAAIVFLWAAMSVWQFAENRPSVGVLFAAFAIVGAAEVVMEPRWRRGCARAERVNRELLERAGEPYLGLAGDSRRALAEPSRPALVVCVVAALVIYSAGYGALMLAIDGERITTEHVAARGLPFGVLMTIANLTWLRWRNRRATSD
jgi:hypothetical protein